MRSALVKEATTDCHLFGILLAPDRLQLPAIGLITGSVHVQACDSYVADSSMTIAIFVLTRGWKFSSQSAITWRQQTTTLAMCVLLVINSCHAGG